MPLDTSVFNNIDTQFGQKLGNIFDPTVIAERQNRLSDLANQRSMQQMQMMQGIDAMNKTRAIQNILKNAGGDNAKAVQDMKNAGHFTEAAQLQALYKKENTILPENSTLIGPDNAVVARGAQKPVAPSWHVIDTPQGQQLVDANNPNVTPRNFGNKPRTDNPAPISQIRVIDDNPKSLTFGKPVIKDGRTGKVLGLDSGLDVVAQGAKAAATSAGTGAATVDVKQHEAAQAAVENINKLNNTLNQLKSSNAITGMGSDVLKNIERAKVLIANDKAAGKVVSDTELLDAMLGSDVFPMIQQLGIGARGMDTPAERDFLRSVMTGTTPMNKATLIRLTEIRRDIAKRAIDRWNNRINSGELDNYFKATGRNKELIGNENIPQPSPTRTQSGATTSGW